MWNNHYFKVVIHPYMGHFDPFFTSILVYPGVVPRKMFPHPEANPGETPGAA